MSPSIFYSFVLQTNNTNMTIGKYKQFLDFHISGIVNRFSQDKNVNYYRIYNLFLFYGYAHSYHPPSSYPSHTLRLGEEPLARHQLITNPIPNIHRNIKRRKPHIPDNRPHRKHSCYNLNLPLLVKLLNMIQRRRRQLHRCLLGVWRQVVNGCVLPHAVDATRGTIVAPCYSDVGSGV